MRCTGRAFLPSNRKVQGFDVRDTSPPKPASQFRLGSTPMQEEPALMDLVFLHRRFYVRPQVHKVTSMCQPKKTLIDMMAGSNHWDM